MWNAVVALSGELIHIVTGQPYKLPGKVRPTQDQRMYEMVKAEGVEAAIEWFEQNGKRAAWGGTLFTLAQRLIRDGRVDQGIRLMEFDAEMTPGKVWLLRKAAQACLDNGRPERAAAFVEKALKLRPDDEEFLAMKAEVEGALDGRM